MSKTKQEAYDRLEREMGVRNLLEEIKAITGNEVSVQYYMYPREDSPMGKLLAKELAKFDGVSEAMYEAYREASLRVSLGKEAEEKLKELKAFSAQLSAILDKLGV